MWDLEKQVLRVEGVWFMIASTASETVELTSHFAGEYLVRASPHLTY